MNHQLVPACFLYPCHHACTPPTRCPQVLEVCRTKGQAIEHERAGGRARGLWHSLRNFGMGSRQRRWRRRSSSSIGCLPEETTLPNDHFSSKVAVQMPKPARSLARSLVHLSLVCSFGKLAVHAVWFIRGNVKWAYKIVT